MHKFTSFNDFFDDEYTYQTNNDSRINVSSNMWIYGCTFKNIEYFKDKGCCICKDSSTYLNLLIEYSSFNTCINSGAGGAIYFGSSGQCVLSSVCGVRCNTGNEAIGQFCLIQLTNNKEYKNHIIDSSVTLTKQTNARSTLCHRYGNVSCKGVNISNNEAYQYSGIEIYNPSISSISFSSFRNNKASEYICIRCYSSTHQMTNTNIIENNQQSTFLGIIYTTEDSANLTMKHCSVYGNCNNGKGTVFYVSSGSITCTDCSLFS